MNNIVISYHLKLYKEIDVVVGLIENGLTHFHLRKHDLSIYEYRKILLEIPSEYHNRIILHSHFELLQEFDLKGYHLTSEERSNVVIPENNLTKSTFAKDFNILPELDGRFEHIIIGPVFKSISKRDLEVRYNHDFLCTQFRENDFKSQILAIGGIKENTTEIALNYGFSGVAILGSIWATYMETFNVQAAIDKYISIRNVSVVMKN